MRLDHVTVRAGRKILLDDVSLAVTPGEVLVILGPNGAGKSTLLDVLAGSRPPDRGAATLDGIALDRIPAPELARRRAVVLQAARLDFAFSVLQVVILGRHAFADTAAAAHDAAAIAHARDTLGLQGLWARDYTSLFGGEQQRVQLARAAAQVWRPAATTPTAYLLLDEPTSALDLRHRRNALDMAQHSASGGLGVAAVLHDLNLAARYADRAVLLRAGKILVQGPAAAVLTVDNLQACFETPIETACRADGSALFVT